MSTDMSCEIMSSARGTLSPSVSVAEQMHSLVNYNFFTEIINREMGLTYPCGTSKSDLRFEQKFYGSLHVVYRMEKLHHLYQHKGCVNSINFHPQGKVFLS